MGSVHLHLENLTVNREHAVSEYHVGEIVMVAACTCKRGPNPEHGPANIVARKLNDFMIWVYDVEFMGKGGRKEVDVNSEFLSFYIL